MLVLVGCGGSSSYECAVPGIRTVESEVAIDCQAVIANVNLARRMFDTAGLLLDSDFDAAFGDVKVIVYGPKFVKPTPVSPHAVGGYYLALPTPTVHLGNNDMMALAHELLHHLDFRSGNVLTGSHDGWKENGYHDVAVVYATGGERQKVSRGLVFDEP